MADFLTPFNKHLEAYLFRVSLNVIDLADTKTQTELIDLIHRINPAVGPVEQKLPEGDSQSSATEWELVLDKSIDHQSVYHQWLICLTRDRARRQGAYIHQIEETIRFTQQQSLLIQAQTFSEVIQLRRTHRNQTILKQQQRYLASAYQTKKVIFDQLSRLVHKDDAYRSLTNDAIDDL